MAAEPTFEWDDAKDRVNQDKHGVSFAEAQTAFFDSLRVIVPDLAHDADEERYFCFGWVAGGVLTVRFTWRGEHVRIIGAAAQRKESL